MMKKITTFAILILFATLSFAQSGKTKSMLKEIENQWKLDDNGNVTYVLVVDAPDLTKIEIYNRVLSYFVYNYGSGKSVIQTQDTVLGRIVGKGYYKNVHIGISLVTTFIDCWHIVRVDVKHGKARIILSLIRYDKKVSNGDGLPTYFSMKVKQQYPIKKKSYSKTVMGKAFYKSHKAAIASINAIKKSIITGNTSKDIENNDW